MRKGQTLEILHLSSNEKNIRTLILARFRDLISIIVFAPKIMKINDENMILYGPYNMVRI